MNPLHAMVRFYLGVASRCRNLWFRSLGVDLGGYVWMRRVSIPKDWSDIRIEKGVALDDGVVLLCSGDRKRDRLIIRTGTYINRYTIIDVSERVQIGENCMIGPHCYITDHDHGYEEGTAIGRQALVSDPVRIGCNVWLGAGVIVLKGVAIGDNVVVGAGAVVTSNVPDNARVAGIPARQLPRCP